MTTLNVDNGRPEEWLNAYGSNGKWDNTDTSKQVGCMWNNSDNDSPSNNNIEDGFNSKWTKWVTDVNCDGGQASDLTLTKNGEQMKCLRSPSYPLGTDGRYRPLLKNMIAVDATLAVRPDKVNCPTVTGTTQSELSESKILKTNMDKMNSGVCPMAKSNSGDDIETLEPILNCTYTFNNTPGSQTPNETIFEFIKMAGWSTDNDNYFHPQNNEPYLTSDNQNVLDDYMVMFCFSDDLENDTKPRCLNTTDGVSGVPSASQLCTMWRKSRPDAWDQGAINYCHSQVSNTEQPSYCRCLNLAVEGSNDYNSYLSIQDSNYTGEPKCWFTPCQSAFIVGGAEQILTDDLYENKCTSESPTCVQINQITDSTFNDFNNQTSMNCTDESGDSSVETTDTPSSSNSTNEEQTCESSDDCSGFLMQCDTDSSTCKRNNTMLGLIIGGSSLVIIIIVVVLILLLI